MRSFLSQATGAARQAKTRFSKDRRGGVAIFVLLASPIALMLTLGSVEISRNVMHKHSVQIALDSGVLAATRELAMDRRTSNREIRDIWNRYVDADLADRNNPVTCQLVSESINRGDIKVTVKLTCEVNGPRSSYLPASLGTFDVESETDFDLGKLDVAFMLDVSGSMRGNKLRALKDSMNDAIDILANMNRTDEVKMAINTYSTAINIGRFARRLVGPNRPDDCIGERTGRSAFTDDRPRRGEFAVASQGCPDSELIPLTMNVNNLKRFVNGLEAGGWTAGHLGTAWAWYLISENWANLWPARSAPRPKSERGLMKAVVLMTDGIYNRQYEPAQGRSAEQAVRMCDAMKDDGVLVYTVAFRAPASAKRTLDSCATAAETSFVAEDEDELRATYEQIARSFTRLLLTQ